MAENEAANRPSMEAASEVLARIQPGSEPISIEPLPGSYSNYTHLVTARLADGSTSRCVIRRYKVFGDYDRGEKALREFRTLERMFAAGVPVPRPLLLDADGELLSTPGMVSAYVPGRLVDGPDEVRGLADRLGATLGRIHNVEIDPETRSILLDANAEVTWFIRGDSIPAFMAAHPEGRRVWELVKNAYPIRQPVPPGPVHVDYWLGNILWQDDQVAAVVDWEEAAWGDPEIDAAYLRLDLILRGYPETADAFLPAYEHALGRPVRNLALWELVAAARPMFSPEGWVSESPAVERFKGFIDEAVRRLA